MTSSTRHSVRYRCRKNRRGDACNTYFRHDPKSHKEPRCPSCHKPNPENVEKWRRKSLDSQVTCKCSGYPFLHRAGSLRMCTTHPKMAANVEPTQEEISDYESCLETPRSSYM